MVNKIEKDYLAQPIIDLPFSNHFKTGAEQLYFKTIGDILQNDVAVLLKMPGFTYHMLQELVQLTEKKKLTHLLKQ